jgi:hypothetical protein
MLKAIVMCLSLAGLMLGGAACGGDDIVDDAQKLADEVCACKDVACLEKAEAKGEEMKKKYQKSDKPSDEVMKKLMEIGKKVNECENRIKGQAGGEAAPQ